MNFHGSMSDSKPLYFFGTQLSILFDHNNSLVWMVSLRPPIDNYSNSITMSLGIVLSTSNAIGIIIIIIIIIVKFLHQV